MLRQVSDRGDLGVDSFTERFRERLPERERAEVIHLAARMEAPG